MAKKKILPPNSEIFCLKIALKYSKPPIWRRVEVDSRTTLSDFHFILQAAMGWENSHLWEFQKGNVRYGIQQDDELSFFTDRVENAGRVRLLDVFPRIKSRIGYLYDFGDSWEHEIVLEKQYPPEPDVHYPRCIKGKMACPPEDCGGIPGYYYRLEIIDDPSHEEYDETIEWMGEEFDPNLFDMEKVNTILKKFD